jgi:adenine-specific DNA-methyltransferase
MASLAEREGLRGQVQCIYFDPPYGIKFNSNFQWSTTSREVKDGKSDHITREPEQVKAFRDTWRDGIHSYLTYLRDRLTVARDLLAESGSIFVQIGDENVHLIKSVLIEVFGERNYINTIAVKKKGSTLVTESVFDFIVWFAKSAETVKVRKLTVERRSVDDDDKFNTLISPSYEMIRPGDMNEQERRLRESSGWRWARVNYPLVSQHPHDTRGRDYCFRGRMKKCGVNRQWTFDVPAGMDRLARADRLFDGGGSSLGGVVLHGDRPRVALSNLWDDVKGEENAVYVVQTAWRIVLRCLLMTTDPGDLVLDPTCGSGTAAYVAEQWGRRWITIDTSRVALALARARIMGARYPYYLLADSREGQKKEAEVTGSASSTQPVHGNVRLGFVYERVPHITLKAIADNTEIDVIYVKWQAKLDPLREKLNKGLMKSWEEWEIPRDADAKWSAAVRKLHEEWWTARIARQTEIDASIAAKAEFEYLYDKPYEDKKRVRVAGPFTVESLSPHRVLGLDESDELIDSVNERKPDFGGKQSFPEMIMENLRRAGVQQAQKLDKIEFTSLVPWPGQLICGEGLYQEGQIDRRAAIFIGPEFGTVSRPDLVAAAREAADAGFDTLIACAFNYEAHVTEFNKLGRIPVLKARMNADLHMSEDLKNTGKGNLFVIFGEPDIELMEDKGSYRVKINGVDVFHPNTGEVRSDGAEGIACWFIDTDYNEESFFVRHAYFLGANDPYGSLKKTLKAEIDAEAWESLYSDTSRPFEKPKSGRIAVKVINHLGDEVMKVFRVV